MRHCKKLCSAWFYRKKSNFMKRGLCIFFFLFAYTMQAQVINPDELIHKIFATLQAKDEKAFLALCPDSMQLVQIMKRLADGVIADIKADVSQDLSRSSMASFDKSLNSVRSSLQRIYSPKEIQRIKQSFTDDFRSIIKDGEMRGIDWATTTFINYTLDSTENGRSLYGQSLPKHSDLQSMRGKIYFKDRDSTCQLWFSDLLFISEENRWYAGTLIWLILSGDHVVEVRGVVIQNIQDAPPTPPPPSLKKKTKNKVSSAKKKRLSKS